MQPAQVRARLVQQRYLVVEVRADELVVVAGQRGLLGEGDGLEGGAELGAEVEVVDLRVGGIEAPGVVFEVDELGRGLVGENFLGACLGGGLVRWRAVRDGGLLMRGALEWLVWLA